jgi:hypothetical protein
MGRHSLRRLYDDSLDLCRSLALELVVLQIQGIQGVGDECGYGVDRIQVLTRHVCNELATFRLSATL